MEKGPSYSARPAITLAVEADSAGEVGLPTPGTILV
jgi:hypothetical protein